MDDFQNSGFAERRKEPASPMMLLLQQMHQSQIDMDTKLTKHMTEETHELAEAIAELIGKAFPEGDPDGHRIHHELVIEREKERVDFWRSMRKKLAEWGLMGFLGWAVYAMWNSFLQGPHK